MSKKVLKSVISAILCIGLTLTYSIIPAAADKTEIIWGNSYELDANSKYEFGLPGASLTSKNAGSLTISGDIGEKTIADVAQYSVNNGLLSFTYTPNETYTGTNDKEWHFVEDGSRDVINNVLPDAIKTGAIVVQTSFDRNKWVTVSTATNIFADNALSSPFYTTNDIQLTNGCYYRVIVAYLTAKVEDGANIKILLWDTPWALPNTSYQKHAEVYEFYAGYVIRSANLIDEKAKTYNLGKTVAVVEGDGFSEVINMDKDNPHLGWELGQFEIKGFTDNYGDSIFLKTVGDEILFQFKLKPDADIDAIKGKSNLSISDVTNGFDRLLNVAPQKFGRGTFILRKTDYTGKTQDPIIYTDFLKSLAYPGAYTKVKLLEEGDYEVALDYEIKDSNLFGGTYDYRIAFSFKIRNSNTDVYPLDKETGGELKGNTIIAPKGFVLDWAKSRYLNTNIQLYTWQPSSKESESYNSHLVFNQSAKENDVYDKEGVYKITVTNPTTDPYGNNPTIKWIYVGNDPIIIASMKGKYGNPEDLNNAIVRVLELKNDGYTIDAKGNLKEPDQSTTAETTMTETTSAVSSSEITSASSETTTTISEQALEAINTDIDVSPVTNNASSADSNILIIVLIVVVVVAAGSVIAVMLLKKKKPEKVDSNNKDGVE